MRLILGILSLMAALLSSSATSLAASSSSGLKVVTENIIFVPTTNQSVQVINALDLNNDASEARDVQLRLPNGFQDLKVLGQTNANQDMHNGWLILPHAAKPHSTTPITVTYTLPFQDGTNVQLQMHSSYTANLIYIYIPIGNIALSATNLMPQTQTTEISGSTYRVFTHSGESAGADWNVSLSLLPQATPEQTVKGMPIIGMNNESKGNTLQAIGNLAVAALILAIGLIGIRSTFYGKRKEQRLDLDEALYSSWARIEREYQNGALSEADYQFRRNALKRKLVERKIATHQPPV
ncbi:hypothetical protein JZ785_13690 [Alicyclobacillus curvatus]|nr:hypothetical protein JZ785_13690 [Alicyclobacillus curvatus]